MRRKKKQQEAGGKMKKKEKDYVLFKGELYQIKSLSSPLTSQFLVGGSARTESPLAWLKPISKYAEEPEGWINIRRIRLISSKDVKKILKKLNK